MSSFNKAISDFTFDMANGDLICKLAKQGYSVKRIKSECDYPVSEEKIRQTVWEYYLESGIIMTDEPQGKITRSEYVMDIGKYGKRSFRQVNEEVEKKSYVACDFGLLKAHSPDEYKQKLSKLDRRKREFVEGLPWPDKVVYHEDNLHIREILSMWNSSK